MLLTSLLRVLLTRSFKPFIFENKYQDKLDFENLNDLGLYVHIPFCRSLCGFCPYCKEIYDKEKADSYKITLLKEIEIACKGMTQKKQVTSLYFGGGTPALMLDDLKDIISKLKEYFIITEGIGVELHPGDISHETLEKLKSTGVSMVSIGIQSFNNECLGKIGRNEDFLIEKLQLVRNYLFDVVDVDLIFAIPGQTAEMLENDIKTAFENGATQISAYPFIDFTFADNESKPMTEKVKKKMLKRLTEYCHYNNLIRTSVWTFAKPGTEKYSSITRDAFLGFGVSATTLLKNSFKINTFSIAEYIKRIDHDLLPTSLTLNFTKRQRAVYYLFWSAYSMKIDLDRFKNIVGIPLKVMFSLEFLLARKTKLIRKKGNIYKLTNKAADFYHFIEQVYTTAYIDKMWNISRNTAFPDKIILK